MRTYLFATLLLFCLVSRTLAGEPGFDLTVTRKDFDQYFPTYLANGFFSTNSSLRGTDATLSLMVGVMDYTPSDVPRPAALPSWGEIDYFDGVAWLNATSVTANSFRDYRQTLDMYDGILHTEYVFVSGGHSTHAVVTTFVSENATHVGVTSLSLTPNFAGAIRLRFTLRPFPAPPHRFPLARLTYEELQIAAARADAGLRVPGLTSPDWKAAMAWYPGYIKIQSFGGSKTNHIIWITGRAVEGPQIAEAAALGLPPGVTPAQVKLQESPQLVCLEVALRVERGRTYTFTKYVAASRGDWRGWKTSLSASREDLRKLKSAVINWAEAARREGDDSLLAKHESAWHRLWKSDILVQGDPAMQRVIHSDLFSLVENSTVNTAWPMGACGLSLYYLYHVFWDNDSWDFPALVLLHPERAKSLEMFRYRTLPAAEVRARKRGYRGAMYPWASDPQKGIETTAKFFLWGAEHEIHIDADIAIAQWEYYLATGDRAWLKDYGYKVIREIAEFWVSRVTYNREKDRYEILHVTSPEEAYNDVADNSFTNAVAQKALRVAVAAAGIVGQPPDARWAKIAQKMYIPFSKKEQRHLDDDSGFHTGKTWMGSAISWLAYPPLDLPMSREIRQKDFDFAVKSLSEFTPGEKDINDMVPVMLSIEAAELSEAAEAYKWLKLSVGPFLKPPFNVRSETPRNNHLYILCISSGFLENFIYGFSGLRLTDRGLTRKYAPVLPAAWESVTLKGIKLHGQSFDFVLSRNAAGKVHLTRRPSGFPKKFAGSQSHGKE